MPRQARRGAHGPPIKARVLRTPGVRQGYREAAAPRPVVQAKPPGYREELCAFFRGTGTDIECRTLEQILTWDDQLMEVCHDYIQWILPTDEASKFNSDAPVLDAEVQRIFRSDEVIRRNLWRGAEHFFNFLGLVVEHLCEDGTQLRIVRSQNFPRRILMCWKGPANHNWKRVSRALRCLGLVGMEAAQQALLTCLEGIIVDYPGMVDELTIGHWLNQACVKSKLVHSVTPGYASALLGSPNLLASLCRQYFGRFDDNGDGRLELAEIRVLAIELHRGLGLPDDALDDRALEASITLCGTGGTLTAEEFQPWFAQTLERTLAKSQEAEGAGRPEKLKPEYITAVLQSPQLLCSLCKQYFARYDHNENGRIDASEGMSLVTDLHDGLGPFAAFAGLSMDATAEKHLQEMLAEFANGGFVDAEDFPAWFQRSLRRASECE